MATFDADTELRKRIAQARKRRDGSVLFVLGSGVAKGASGGAGAADWAGLLDLGLSACDALKAKGSLKSPATWDGVELRRRLESKSADDLIAVASAVEKALRSSGVYEGFLRDSVGALPLKSREVCDALAELALPVATCNYDGLLEKALLRPPISWRDHGMVLRFLKGQQDGILHLHGHYNEPESVVLGIESYSKIVGSEHAQAVQRLLFLDRTLVFVGFGAGLADPNFGALLRWATQVVPGTDCFHVRLGRDSEVGDLMAVHPLTQRIHVLGYGLEHKDLAPYLRSLLQKRTTKSTSLGKKGSEGSSSRSESRITIAFVRQQLNQHLRSASDFDAFCLDYFSEVYARFTSGMDRVSRTSLLLSIADPKRVYEQLMAYCAGLSTGDPAPPPPAPEPPTTTSGLRDATVPRSPEPPPPASRGTPAPRPQVNALLFLDRTAQYGRLLLGAARSRAQNRALLLYGGPEQNLEWFVRRVEEFLQDDHATGCKVVNVPLRLNNVYAGTAADWGLHLILQHTLTALLTALRLYRVVSAMQFAQSILFAVISLGLMWRWPTMNSILFGYAIACLASSAGAIVWAWPAFRDLDRPEDDLVHREFWGKLLRFAFFVWVTNLLTHLFAIVDRYMIVHCANLTPTEALEQALHDSSLMVQEAAQTSLERVHARQTGMTASVMPQEVVQ